MQPGRRLLHVGPFGRMPGAAARVGTVFPDLSPLNPPLNPLPQAACVEGGGAGGILVVGSGPRFLRTRVFRHSSHVR